MKQKTRKIIIDVAPITPLPLANQQFYSYLWKKKIPTGSLVSISLSRRILDGIVINNREDFHRLGNIELKNIHEIIEENFLDAKQIELARFISEYYFSPLGKVLKFFIPKRTKQRHKSQNTNGKQNTKKIKLTNEQQKAADIITTGYLKFTIKNLKFLLYGPASSGKTEVYIHSILKLKEKNPGLQFLILLPELTLTQQAIERYGEYFDSSEIVVLNSKVSKGQLYSDWQKIKSGEAKIVIGSRAAIFAPFKKLGLIVIDEEQDISHKQWDMNPRYDARTVAEKMTQIHNCPAVFGSATPRVEDFWKAASGKYKLLKLPEFNLPNARRTMPTVKIELVDMKKERWQKNYSPISKRLRAEIAYALKNKLQTILLINRQGMSSFSICTRCKTVLRCPKCRRALIYDKEGIYRCAHCAYKTSILPHCPQCKNITFTNIGLGTQKIEREILNLFPQAKLARADSQSMRAPNAQKMLYENFKSGEIDILVGTQMISKGWDLPNVSLIGIIDGDGMLSVPDFTASERAFQTLIQVSGRTGRPGAKFPGLVLLQTFNPEQIFFKTIAEKNLEKFYAKELQERKTLNLPPFGKLIKLTFQDYSPKKVATEAAHIFSDLEEKKTANVAVSEPLDAFVENIRGRHRKQIVLKIFGEIPEYIKKIIRRLPNGWTIDADPISIL